MLSGEMSVSSPNGAALSANVRIGDSGSSSQGRCLALHAGMSWSLPCFSELIVTFSWWQLLFGAKVCTGVHRTLSTSLPHPAPRSSCPFRGRHQRVRELSYPPKVTLFTLGEWHGVREPTSFKFSPPPTLPQHPGPLTSKPVPKAETKAFSVHHQRDGPCEGI